jgi:peptide deformylase
MKKRKNRVTAKLVIAPNDILTKVCEPVADGEDVSGIIRDMMHILVNNSGAVGLAAPQAGHLRRIIIAEVEGNFVAMINPEIQRHSKEERVAGEKCLSYPGEKKDISRYIRVDLHWINEEGLHCVFEFKDWTARIIQHEIDHLNGKCKVGVI